MFQFTVGRRQPHRYSACDMNRTVWLFFVLAFLSVCGCRTYIPYTPTPISDPAEARRVIQRTLEEQRIESPPVHVEVTNEKFRAVRSRHADAGDLFGTSVYYARIEEVLLSKRRGVYAVTILGADRELLMHVFPYDQDAGERFMDALAMMRSIPPSPSGPPDRAQ